MSTSRLSDCLDHMHQAAADACGFVQGMNVWQTVQVALPALLAQLPAVRLNAASADSRPDK